MTLVAEIDGVALPDGALLITGSNIAGINGLPTSAYYGEALTGGIQVDDPDGNIELEGLHVLTVDETACTGAERIWTGWISGRRVSRGPLPYKSGVSRVWDVDIIEANWAFALMVFRASSAKRPAETDLVRAQFIIESAPMAFTPVVDNGRANFTDNPVNFDDSDLVTKYPIEGFNEFVGISGKNFYAYWDHDEAELSFHYDLMGVGPTSTLAISNDIADTDSTTFYPFLDAQLNMTGAWTVTGMLLGYRGAYAYGIRQATIDALSPTVLSPSEFQRDEVYRTDRIGRAATANAQIASMLEARAEDQTTITVSIRVPAAQVNLIEAGMLVSFKATHLPGYETPVEIPVIRRTVVPTEGRTDSYDLHLELSGSPGTAGPGGGNPGGFPHTGDCVGGSIAPLDSGQSDTTVADDEHTLSSLSVAGDDVLLIAFTQTRDAADLIMPSGWTMRVNEVGSPGFGDDIQYTICDRYVATGSSPYADVFESTAPVLWCTVQAAFRSSSAPDPNTASKVENFLSPGGTNPTIDLPITATAGRTLLALAAYTTSVGGTGPGIQWPVGWTVLESISPASTSLGSMQAAYRIADGTESSLDVSIESTNVEMAAVLMSEYFIDCEDTPPGAGQPVPETPAGGDTDGVNDDFTTPYPFADESLEVYHDGTDQTPHVSAYDGEAGTFTLDYAPSAGSVITVRFQGR